MTERFDIVATGAYVFTENQSGLQDGGLFVKYRPFYEKIGNAGRLGVLFGTGASFPLSDYEPVATGAFPKKPNKKNAAPRDQERRFLFFKPNFTASLFC